MTEAAPTTANRTLRRLPNAAYRPREYLTDKEVDRLIEAARRRGRNGTRDAAAILLAYRHGLRAQELCSLQWSQVDLRHGRLIESVHPVVSCWGSDPDQRSRPRAALNSVERLIHKRAEINLVLRNERAYEYIGDMASLRTSLSLLSLA
jgi:integrase